MSILCTGRLYAARTRLIRLYAASTDETLMLDIHAALIALDGYQRVRDAMEAYSSDEYRTVTCDYVLRLLDGEVG